jgi:hypothetical protein
MTNPKAMQMPTKPAATQVEPSRGLIGAWTHFWFAPADPIALHVLRVLAGVLFLYWLLPFAGSQAALFGLGGWFDATAYREASRLPELPPHLFGWSVVYLCGANPIALAAVYWLSIAAIVLFTLGVATRLTGVLTWVAAVSYTANPALAYDADPLLVMLAFYLMFGYLLLGLRSPRQSWVGRVVGSMPAWLSRRAAPPEESVAANLAMRLFQVHFAIAMVASGLQKLQFREWWSGLATWFYLNPPFHTTREDVRSFAPNAETFLTLFTLASYVALAWQLAFPAFAWRRSLRPVLLGGAVVAWLVGAFIVTLPLFGALMMVACLGYLTPAEWRRLQSLAGGLPVVRGLFARLSPEMPAAGLRGPKSAIVARVAGISLGQRS